VIGQCLSNKNESATVAKKNQNFCKQGSSIVLPCQAAQWSTHTVCRKGQWERLWQIRSRINSTTSLSLCLCLAYHTSWIYTCLTFASVHGLDHHGEQFVIICVCASEERTVLHAPEKTAAVVAPMPRRLTSEFHVAGCENFLPASAWISKAHSTQVRIGLRLPAGVCTVYHIESSRANGTAGPMHRRPISIWAFGRPTTLFY